MLTIKEMEALLEKSLQHKRFEHSLAVFDTAVELARIHGADEEKVAIAALLHDCGREIPTRRNLAQAAELGIPIDEIEANQPILLHAKLGVHYAQHKYGVADKEIFDAILYHTTGAPGMTQTAVIVYLADLLEPKRGFYGIDEMRSLAKTDLEKTLLKAYAMTIRYLLEHDLLIHPNCIYGRNELAIKFKQMNRTF